jgi:hypothetical protein
MIVLDPRTMTFSIWVSGSFQAKSEEIRHMIGGVSPGA